MATTVGRVNSRVEGVYIGRPYYGQEWRWGNPFMIGDPHPLEKHPMSRAEVVEEFAHWLENSMDVRAQWMRANVHSLKGKHLQCFCHPLPCHGDVLAKRAEAT